MFHLEWRDTWWWRLQKSTRSWKSSTKHSRSSTTSSGTTGGKSGGTWSTLSSPKLSRSPTWPSPAPGSSACLSSTSDQTSRTSWVQRETSCKSCSTTCSLVRARVGTLTLTSSLSWGRRFCYRQERSGGDVWPSPWTSLSCWTWRRLLACGKLAVTLRRARTLWMTLCAWVSTSGKQNHLFLQYFIKTKFLFFSYKLSSSDHSKKKKRTKLFFFIFISVIHKSEVMSVICKYKLLTSNRENRDSVLFS